MTDYFFGHILSEVEKPKALRSSFWVRSRSRFWKLDLTQNMTDYNNQSFQKIMCSDQITKTLPSFYFCYPPLPDSGLLKAQVLEKYVPVSCHNCNIHIRKFSNRWNSQQTFEITIRFFRFRLILWIVFWFPFLSLFTVICFVLLSGRLGCNRRGTRVRITITQNYTWPLCYKRKIEAFGLWGILRFENKAKKTVSVSKKI